MFILYLFSLTHLQPLLSLYTAFDSNSFCGIYSSICICDLQLVLTVTPSALAGCMLLGATSIYSKGVHLCKGLSKERRVQDCVLRFCPGMFSHKYVACASQLLYVMMREKPSFSLPPSRAVRMSQPIQCTYLMIALVILTNCSGWHSWPPETSPTLLMWQAKCIYKYTYVRSMHLITSSWPMQSMTSFGHMFDDITAKHVYYCGDSGEGHW